LRKERRRLLDALLDAVGEGEWQPDAEVAARLGPRSGPGARLAERVHDFLGGSPLRRASADDAVDAVLGHEVQGARAGADYRLPALDGQCLRAWHQRDLLELVAPVGHLGREGVVLAVMRKGALVERFENDLDLLLEQLPVGVLIWQRRAEGLDLPRAVAAPA